VLLLPTPLPTEKQRKLPTTPILMLIQTPSPMLSQVEGGRLELAADAWADVSKFAGVDADGDACEDK
jgi:hypothetical protein